MFKINTVEHKGKTMRILVLVVENVEIQLGFLDRFNNLYVK